MGEKALASLPGDELDQEVPTVERTVQVPAGLLKLTRLGCDACPEELEAPVGFHERRANNRAACHREICGGGSTLAQSKAGLRKRQGLHDLQEPMARVSTIHDMTALLADAAGFLCRYRIEEEP